MTKEPTFFIYLLSYNFWVFSKINKAKVSPQPSQTKEKAIKNLMYSQFHLENSLMESAVQQDLALLQIMQ